MIETLPITINLVKELNDQFSKLTSICNKLEAQFNFQTLTANWYGNEEKILTIQLFLEVPLSFIQQQKEVDRLSLSEFEVRQFSDDVISCFNQDEQQLLCHVAITHSELALLELKPKILSGFVQAKLHKVLNLIAQQHSLPCI
jgi:hypothetical protein